MNVHAPHAHLVPGEVKRGLDPLGLELWMVVSYSVDGGNQTQVLGNSSKAIASHPTLPETGIAPWTLDLALAPPRSLCNLDRLSLFRWGSPLP